MMLPEIHVENKQIQFPISVNPKSSFEFQYVSSMHPGNLTEAQIAVKSSNENCLETIFEARINYIYGDNEEEEKKENFTISLKPFTNLLVRYWQNKDKKEILKLAKKIK